MKKKHWFLKIFSFFAIFSFLINCMCGSAYAVQKEQKVSQKEVLICLGFTTEEQQDAFKSIYKIATGKSLPEWFGIHELFELVELMQIFFVNRADRQERWETTDLNWMVHNVESLNKKFAVLVLADTVWPNKKYYDAVCILGARRSEMEKRIKFVEYLDKQGYHFDKVFLLTGDRDATPEEITQSSMSGKVTETRMFIELFKKSSLNGNCELIVVDTKKANGQRPTTQTTVQDFCKWDKEHPGAIEDALFISSQPYVAYQTAIIEEILRQNNSDLLFRVAGDSYVPSNDSVKTLAGALGSYIWAKMPNCLRHFGFEIKAYEDLELAKRLYGHMPWIYDHLPFSYGLINEG